MTKLLRLVLAVTIATTLHFTATSQSLSINTSGATADPSAILDVTSTLKGMLIPRMDKTEKNAIATPANGLLVFQPGPDSIGFHYYDLPNTQWVFINTNGYATDTTAWKLTGNSNVADTSFLGSINNQSLRFRVNNIASGQINDTTTYFGYKAGLTNPTLVHNIGIGSSALQNNNTTHNIAIGDSALYANAAGGVTAIGYKALMANAGFDNIAIGYSALDSNTTGGGNTGIGNFALRSNIGTSRNTAVGSYAMVANKASFGTGVGEFALTSNTTGGGNTVVGSNALVSNTTGAANTSIGTNTMFYNITGGSNTVVGYQAMLNNDSSSGNTAIGRLAMFSHRGLNGNNTAVGRESMQFDSIGFTNVAVGWRSLRNHKSGGDNVAIGVGALESDSSGNNNTAVGRSSQFLHKKGNWNTSIGISSALAGDSTYEVTALGTQAAYYNKVPYTTAVGTNALLLNNYYTNNDPGEGKENTAVGQLALSSNVVGTKNTAVGYHALNSYGGSYWVFSSNRNTAVGDSAATATIGQDNVAIGSSALTKNFTGSQHVAVGSRALANTTAGYPNTAVGASSQDSATTGYANTSLGSFTLMNNKIGYNNTAIGNAAMLEAFNPSGSNSMFDNTAVGNDALRFTRYYGQTAIGAGALRNDTAGIYNTAVGFLAMYENKTGTVNTAIGTSALRFDTSGSGNVAVGVNALYSHRTGNNNVAMGYNALFNSRDGFNNTAIGNYAMLNHRTNGHNTAVGYQSMESDTSGFNNTAMGWRSLRTVTSGVENTALGVGTLEFSDSSHRNTAVGRYAMFAIGGTDNTAMGYAAMGNGIGVPTTGVYTRGVTSIGANSGFRNTGAENTFVGYLSGYGAGADSLKGIENTGLGSSTLTYTTTGRSNTAVGMASLYSNSTGSGNIGVGTRSLFYNSTASYNVAVGDSALIDNIDGSSNTGIGSFANVSTGNLTNATAIGARAFVAQNNSIILGSINGVNSATSDTRVGIRTTTPDSTFSVADNFLVGSSGTVQYDNSVPVMNYMFKTGFSNADRMVISHSPAFSNYGLQYQDAGDRFNFLSAGASVLTADLLSQRVGIGNNVPAKKLHVFTGTSGAITNAATQILMEDDVNSYLEMSTPDASENGILSSNTAGIRSGIIFGANNNIQLRSGGNISRLTIDNAGYFGVNRTPTAFFTAGTLQVQSPNLGDDIFGIYNSAGTNRWTYYTAGTNLEMYNNGTLRGSWSSVNGVYTSFSDKRLKKDISELPVGVLAKINNLKSYSFRYNDNKSTDPLTIGFMAQDVQPLFLKL
ncbi:MAG: tail fiber domain-containing protein [Chitinophagaceae bacterium]|nr:tail fiber domain-containing protein [Chitinophagaceae bacterium]